MEREEGDAETHKEHAVELVRLEPRDAEARARREALVRLTESIAHKLA